MTKKLQSETLGQKIKEARVAAGLTQVELGYSLDPPLSNVQISLIERWDKDVPAYRRIQAILRKLKIQPD